MPTSAENPAVALLHTVLERVLRTECLVLESLRLQTQGGYNGLPGGGSEEKLLAAEQRAYRRAEILLTQLLAASATVAPLSHPASSVSHDLR